MLAPSLVLASVFGQLSSASDQLLESPLATQNLKQSSSDDIQDDSDTVVYKQCRKPDDECSVSEEDIVCYGAKLPYTSSGIDQSNHSVICHITVFTNQNIT